MSTKKPFSIIKGYSFSFEDEGDLIEVWFSSFSGLEKVFINGELVTEQRNYSKNSSIIFSVGINEYSTTMLVKSLLKGPVVCTLNKNGKAFKRQKVVFIKIREMFNFNNFGIALVLAILLLALNTMVRLPTGLIAVVLFISLFVYFLFFNSKQPIAKIKDEEIV